MRIADLVRDKKIEGIRGLRDESPRHSRRRGSKGGCASADRPQLSLQAHAA
jgi:hypothetical protein